MKSKLILILTAAICFEADFAFGRQHEIVQGTVELVSADANSSKLEFAIAKTDQTKVFSYRAAGENGEVPSFVLYFDARNPFGVSLEVYTDGAARFDGSFLSSDFLNSIQQSKRPDGVPPNFAAHLTLAAWCENALLEADNQAIINNDFAKNAFVEASILDGSVSDCRGFTIRQSRDCYININASDLQLEDCPFEPGSKETIDTIETRVNYASAVDLRSITPVPFEVIETTTGSEGSTRVKKSIVKKLKAGDKAAADAFVAKLYEFIGTGRTVVSESNVELAVDKGILMVATDDGLDEQITAMSYFSSGSWWTPLLRIGACLFVLCVCAGGFYWFRGR